MSKFYDSIIIAENEVSKIFEGIGNDNSILNWRDIQTEFHDSIEKNHPAIRCETNAKTAEEKNSIPERLAKRIKVTTLLLNVLVSGGKYSRKLYLNTLDFCSSLDINDRQFALNFSF